MEKYIPLIVQGAVICVLLACTTTFIVTGHGVWGFIFFVIACTTSIKKYDV